MPYYAVRVGRQPGIYNTWKECKKQVHKVFARFKKFSTLEEAQDFMNAVDPKDASKYTQDKAPLWLRNSGMKRKNENDGGESSKRSKPADDQSRVVVYSDGCCFANGRRGAKAGIGVYWRDGHHRNISEPLQGTPKTNQRAELNAAIRALEMAEESNITKLEIKTDSMYTINAVTQWMHNWKRNGFKTVNGTDVKNREDITKLYSLCQRIDVKWTHVRGHQGHEGNERADELAKQGAEHS